MKLLRKTVRSYIIYALAVMLIAVPVFYFVTRDILSRDVDIRLISEKSKLLEKLGAITDITQIRMIEPDAEVVVSNDRRDYDTLYTVRLLDRRISRIIPYRILQSNLTIKNIRYTIRLQNSLVEKNELLENIVLVQFVLMMIITTGLLLISRILSKKLWLPFFSTLKKLQSYKIESGEHLEFQPTAIDEFDSLNKTISALTKRNVDVYRSQKEFTENAAHEMQSPLAVVHGKIELLMQTAPLSEEQAQLISELSDAGGRMNRLNKSLLLLSKIENNQFPEQEKINVVEILNRILNQYENAMLQKKITLNLQQPQTLIFHINKPLLEVLFTNLISNAIRHNVQDGTIHIILDDEQFLIENSGSGSSLKTEKLFRRFQKQTDKQNSLGLGLEIVKRICDLMGFRVHYIFHEDHHRFIVNF